MMSRYKVNTKNNYYEYVYDDDTNEETKKK
jgi:hypothetical protein